MGDFVFNVAKGRVAELYNRVKTNDPTNAALIVVAINTSETDGNLKDLDTLAAVLANGNTAEVTNSGYARKVLVDSDLNALSPDDTNDRMDLDFADQTWSGVGSGGGWTDLLICYDPDTTSGDDTSIIPLTQHDFAVTPDGSDVTAQLNAAGFYRAS
ncbi:MAG: hypothetical protein R3B95_11515 [Nitrospirales bacterium]|nr:hypothetical protein [Nitrospirales bacterium]